MPKETKKDSLKRSSGLQGRPALAGSKAPPAWSGATMQPRPVRGMENRLNNYSKYQKKTQNPVYTGYSKLDEIRLITVGLASSNRILQWAEKSLPNGKIVGEVTNANTLHHKTFKPVKGGLFCERIFGPLKDFECACSSSLGKKIGKLKLASKKLKKNNNMHGSDHAVQFETPNRSGCMVATDHVGDSVNMSANIKNSLGLSSFNGKRFFCPVCDVEYTWSVIRRYQLGYIKLNAPVTHVWYLKGNPSFISLLLDMKKKQVEYVTYCTETLTLENALKFSVENLYTLAETGLEAQPNELYSVWEKVSGNSVKPKSALAPVTANAENKEFTSACIIRTDPAGTANLLQTSSKNQFNNFDKAPAWSRMVADVASSSERPDHAVSEPTMQAQHKMFFTNRLKKAAWSGATTQGVKSLNYYLIGAQKRAGTEDFQNTSSRPVWPLQPHAAWSRASLVGPDHAGARLQLLEYKKRDLEASLKMKNISSLAALTTSTIKKPFFEKQLRPRRACILGPCMVGADHAGAKAPEKTGASDRDPANLALEGIKMNYWFAYYLIFIKTVKKLGLAWSPTYLLRRRLGRACILGDKNEGANGHRQKNVKKTFQSEAITHQPNIIFESKLKTLIYLLVDKLTLLNPFFSGSVIDGLPKVSTKTFLSRMGPASSGPTIQRHVSSTLDGFTARSAGQHLALPHFKADKKVWFNDTAFGLTKFTLNQARINLNSIYLSPKNLKNLLHLIFVCHSPCMVSAYASANHAGLQSTTMGLGEGQQMRSDLVKSKYFRHSSMSNSKTAIAVSHGKPRFWKKLTKIGLKQRQNKKFLTVSVHAWLGPASSAHSWNNPTATRMLGLHGRPRPCRGCLSTCLGRPNLTVKNDLTNLLSSISKIKNQTVVNILFINRLANFVLKKFLLGNLLTHHFGTLFFSKLARTFALNSQSVKYFGKVKSRLSLSKADLSLKNELSFSSLFHFKQRLAPFKKNANGSTIVDPFLQLEVNKGSVNSVNILASKCMWLIQACISPSFNKQKVLKKRSSPCMVGADHAVPALAGAKAQEKLSKLVNNIYCLSHRLLWDNDKNWQFFAFYYYGFYSFITKVPAGSEPTMQVPLLVSDIIFDKSKPSKSNSKQVKTNPTPASSADVASTSERACMVGHAGAPKFNEKPAYRQPLNLEDKAVPVYAYRNYDNHFSLLNTFFSRTCMVGTDHAGTSRKTNLNISLTPSQLHVSFSGAGMIKTLLADFNYFELKKMDKQNRILLYDLNKYIRKMKKQLTQNKKLVKVVKELYKQRDILIRRTKYIRRIFRNYVSFSLGNSLIDSLNSKSHFETVASTGQQKFLKNSDPNNNTSMVRSNHAATSLNNMGRLADFILEVLPVLPPDLRPIVKMGSQIAASDLNRLYQRVIYRNDRLKKFLKNAATNGSYEMKYAQRLLQESIDNLIQNGKSGVPEKDARGRALKSLSDILKGKQGRFRQYLLGKRVDYSGRSVIVVGPKLKLHECGIPKDMALELYLPFLIKSILNKNLARTVIGAKALIQNNKPLTWSLLREILKTCPVLLNRAPTLHRLGFQAFQPKLVDGKAILLHPLVCPAFNADFDGDQMAVHVPIAAEARAEAWKLMLSRNNLLSPATGEPLVLPSQDMVLGCYYLTTNGNKRTQEFEKGFGLYFDSLNDVLRAYNQGLLSIHAIIWVKWNAAYEQVANMVAPLEMRLNIFGSAGYVIYPKSYKTFQIHKQVNVNQHPTSPERKQTDSTSLSPTIFNNSSSRPALAGAKAPCMVGPDHAGPALAGARALDSTRSFLYSSTDSQNSGILSKTDPSSKWATELILMNNVIRTTPGKILFNVMIQKSLV